MAKLLQILEVDLEKLIPITTPTKFKNVILPDESFFTLDKAETFTAEYRETIDRIRSFALKNLTPLSQKKVYYLHGRGQIGEERLAEYFKGKGYAIVRPENLPIEEQLNLLANCESFASTVGSISHNTIFLKQHTEAILIPRRFIVTYQWALNHVNEINVNFVDSSLSIFWQSTYGPFCYIISPQLKKFFSDESAETYTEEDFATFLQYVRSSMAQNFKEDSTLKEYYSKILPNFYAQIMQRQDLMQKFGVIIK